MDRNTLRSYFTKIVTVENVKLPKPDPEGLLQILNGRDPQTAIYLGDNIDDAVAAKAAMFRSLACCPTEARLAGTVAASFD